MNNQMLPIGRLFNIEKGELQSTKCTPGEYDFITAAEDWKTHNAYSHECEALIFAAAASGSLGRTHYVDGKFTTSDLCYILTPKDEAKYPLNLSFYHFVFNSLRPTLVAATKSGTSKESINQTNFKNYEIPYFDIELQDFWIEKLKNTLGLKELLGSELTQQQILLKKLRQQILQEAIEGKLTVDWRAQNHDVEPASELLKRIAAEKARLVKEKKIKAQKPLPPITDEEKPFELPSGWEWCRTNDVCSYIVDCPHSTPKFQDTGKYCIDTTCINMAGSILIQKIRKVSRETFNERNRRLEPRSGDIIYSREGVVGQAIIVPEGWEVCLGQRVMLFRPFCEISPQFFRYLVTSNFFLEEMFSRHRGAGAKHVNMRDLRESWIPMPPLSEQQVILTMVEKLHVLCDQLEAQIMSNQTHADQLMKVVLKEAFSHNGEAIPIVNKGKASADTRGTIRA